MFRLRYALTALAFGATLTVAGPAEESHAAYSIWICNSVHSRGPIEAWSSGTATRTIVPNTCKIVYDDDGSARIDPDPESVNPYDVDSFKWARESQPGYPSGQCVNGEPHWNPPATSERLFVNTDASLCGPG